MRINLLNQSQEAEDLLHYLDYNFKRLTDVLEQQDNVVSGIAAVTGNLVISTGLALISDVVACLNGVPVAGACFVRARPIGTGTGDITLTVYDNAFAQAVIAKDVNWIATGVF